MTGHASGYPYIYMYIYIWRIGCWYGSIQFNEPAFGDGKLFRVSDYDSTGSLMVNSVSVTMIRSANRVASYMWATIPQSPQNH